MLRDQRGRLALTKEKQWLWVFEVQDDGVGVVGADDSDSDYYYIKAWLVSYPITGEYLAHYKLSNIRFGLGLVSGAETDYQWLKSPKHKIERIRWQPQNIFYYSRPKIDSDSFNFFQICETNSLIQLVAFDELFMFEVKYYCIPLKIFSSLQFRIIEPTWIQRSSAKITWVELEISQLRNWKFTITISC